MSRIHRYPIRSLLADYGRGAVGAGISGTFWALSPVALYSMVLFGGLTALFLLFVLRTALRQRLCIVSDSDGIGAVGRAPLLWRELEDIRLRYYAPRRTRNSKGSPGWMTLKLRAGGRKLVLDSTLDGFDDIAARANQAALASGLDLGEVTLTNLAALGLRADDDARFMALADGGGLDGSAGRGGRA
jgi:hypothetical protein